MSKEQMIRLSDMTWVEQAFNICFLGPPGIGKTHLALTLAVQALDLGYAVAFSTLDELMVNLKTLTNLNRQYETHKNTQFGSTGDH